MTIERMTSKRSIWMALGILWVVFFHTNLSSEYQFFNDFRLYGYGGVDVLLFASGMGCYYSYSKTENPYDFIKRRAIRLLPFFTAFLAVFYGKAIIKMRPNEVLGYFFASRFNWYIREIWLLYLLVPVFYACIKRSQKLLGKIALILLIMLISCAYWDEYAIMVMQSRVPVFVLGMMLGKLCTSEDTRQLKIPVYAYIVSCLFMAAGFAMLKSYYVFEEDITHNIALKWWPFLFVAPGICLVTSYISLLMDKSFLGRGVNRVFDIIGKSTFEIFLIHLFWINKVERFAWAGEKKKWILWALEVTAICAIAVLVEKGFKLLINQLKKRRESRLLWPH